MANQAISKDELFFGKYQLYSYMQFKICILYVKNKPDAEDILQEAFFVELIYKAPSFDSLEYEKAWIIRVTINLCKNSLSRKKRSVDSVPVNSSSFTVHENE